MIKMYGNKVTATELAKYLVSDRGGDAECFCEFSGVDIKDFTDREIEQVEQAIKKQIARVRKFLNTAPIACKIFKD